MKGFVRAIRPGGKIDLSLDAAGYKRVAPLKVQIVEALPLMAKAANAFLATLDTAKRARTNIDLNAKTAAAPF